MNNKVDVIISHEEGQTIVLEVVETNDINKTIERQEYYGKFYKDVHVYSGIDFINADKEDDFIRKFNEMYKKK